jgi:hypothetical protein
VFIIFGNDCEFYRNAKCFKKNAFCDLKCEDDSFKDGFVPLRESMDTEEKSEDNSDLKNLPPLRLPDAILKKERKREL